MQHFKDAFAYFVNFLCSPFHENIFMQAQPVRVRAQNFPMKPGSHS